MKDDTGIMIHGRVRLGVSTAALAMMLAAPAWAQQAVGADVAATGQAAPGADTKGTAEVVVTGQRAAIRSAQNIKRNSDEIVDSIVASDIGKLPDRSVTESLQRVVGVTIDHTMARNDPEHYSVEGSGVNIRGLSYVRSELNGRDSFTANGGRSLSFEDVSPELMAGIDIYKNPSAEQIEGAIGGLVNLRTAMPFDYNGLRASGSLQGSWGDLSRGKATPSGSMLLSDRWDTGIGEIGVLVDLAYSESRTRTDAIQQDPFYPRTDLVPGQTVWMPKGESWRTLQFDRKRKGAYAALQWRPSSDVETSLSFFHSDYKMHWDEDAIFSSDNPYNIIPAAGTSFTFDKDNIFQKGVLTDPTDSGIPFNDDVRSADRRSITNDVSWHLKWKASDRFTLDTDLQYTRGTTKGFDSTVATGINLPSEGIDRTSSIPSIQVDPAFMTNPSNYYWAFMMDEIDHSVGTEKSGRVDGEFKFADGGFFSSLKFGVRIADRKATTATGSPSYNWVPISQTWQLGWNIPRLAYLSEFPAPNQTYAFPNFFNGKIPLPSAVVFPATSMATGWPDSYQQIYAFHQTLCKELNPGCTDTWTATSIVPAGTNDQHERTYAGYASLRFGSTVAGLPFDGNLGVRLVRTEDRANGFLVVNAFTPGENEAGGGFVSLPAASQPVSARNDFTNVLPSLNLRFHLTPKLQARIAVAKAIARPDFSQLQAYTQLSSAIDSGTEIQNFTGTGSGNPYLRPTKSNQFDATLEWYFAPTGSLTFAAFDKDLSDVVINQVYNVTAQTTGGPQTFVVTAPVNGAKGTAKGFEVAFNDYFNFLPGFLSGFGIQANYTFVASKQHLYNPVTSAYCTSSSGGADNLNLNLNGCDTDGRTFGDLPLSNLSRHSYNLALLYDKGPLSARLAYNWRSKYLQAVNVNGTQGTDGSDLNPASATYGSHSVAWGLPVWSGNYGQLDGSIFYSFNDHIQVGIEAQNLTDSKFKQLMQQHIGMMNRAWFVSGRRYTFNLRVTY
jgi:TonB-dependent receptor